MPLEPDSPALPFLTECKQSQQFDYSISWIGSKIPRGASIDGIQIGWTQHGIITGVGGENLGFYDRVFEGGYHTVPAHVMTIRLDKESVVLDPKGEVCQRLTL